MSSSSRSLQDILAFLLAPIAQYPLSHDSIGRTVENRSSACGTGLPQKNNSAHTWPCRSGNSSFDVISEHGLPPAKAAETQLLTQSQNGDKNMRFLSIYKTAERNTPPTPEEMATFGKLIASEKGLRKQYKWLPLRHFKVLEKDRLRTRSGHSPLQTQRKCVARGPSAAKHLHLCPRHTLP